MTISRQLFYTTLSLIVCLLWFEFTPTDMWLQKLFYDQAGQQWLWDGSEPISRFIFYDGIKSLLIIFALGLLACLIFFRKQPIVKSHRKGILIVLLSSALVPLAVGGLKATTNVACPKALAELGGNLPYVKLFQRYPNSNNPETRQRCFPAAHASGGFAMMSLFFLFHSARNRKRALLFGIATGWIMGGYKMLIGDHFLSHTIVSMLLAWMIIELIAWLLNKTAWLNYPIEGDAIR